MAASADVLRGSGLCADEVDAGNDGYISQFFILHIQLLLMWDGAGPIEKSREERELEAIFSPDPNSDGVLYLYFGKKAMFFHKKCGSILVSGLEPRFGHIVGAGSKPARIHPLIPVFP